MKTWILALTLGVIAAAGCGSSDSGSSTSTTGSTGTTGATASASQSLTGAGSTFVNPAMSKWVEAYKDVNKDVSINYQSVGSGAGISNLKDGTVDFACSDLPLDDKALKEMPGEVVQFPVTSGCVAIAYNVPGVETGLKFTGDVLADIFLGKIAKWNDPKIAQLNPGAKLPDLAIAVAHRSDGSGTTYIFTDYLSTVSAAWNAGPGKGKDIKWPVGTGGKGSAGVAGTVKQSPGGIGYVEYAYATQNKMSCGQIQNKSGKYVDPTVDGTAAASSAALDALTKDNRTSIVDTTAPDGYPIAGFTYAMIMKAPKDAKKAQAVVDFLKWVLENGQDKAKELQYAPIPKSLVDLNEKQLATVQAK